MKIGTAIPTKYYELAGELGYDYVEFPGIEISQMEEKEFATLVERVNTVKLPVKGFNAYCNEKVPIVGERFAGEKVLEYAKFMCKRGKQLKIEAIGIGAPMARMLVEGYNLDEADKQAVEFLQITAKEALQHGQSVYFEAVHKFMCTYCNTTTHGKKVVDLVKMDNVKLILDFYHVEVMGEVLEDAVKTQGIAHLHINHLGENYGREYITQKDRDILRRIRAALKKVDAPQTITIEAEAQYFQPFGKEGLMLMREFFADI